MDRNEIEELIERLCEPLDWAHFVNEDHCNDYAEFHGRVANALVHLLQAQTWRPLDTAPLDGTLVDLWVRLAPGRFEKRVPECSWGWIREWTGEEYQGWIGLGHMHEKRIPLAWMPLPQPPSSDEEPKAMRSEQPGSESQHDTQ